MIHEMAWLSMYDTEGNKHQTCIHDDILNCQQTHQQIHLNHLN